MQRRFCMEKAILPFKRSAEGNFDKELRSIEGLEKSIRHLSNEIIDLDNFPNVHY